MGFFEQLISWLDNEMTKQRCRQTELLEEILRYKSEYEKRTDEELLHMLKKQQYTNSTQEIAFKQTLRDRGYGPK